MDQTLEHLADHAEVIGMTFELSLQVDKIGGRSIQSLGEQSAKQKGNLGV
jgi:hypothetical protein